MSNGFDVRGRALQAGELAAWLSEHSLGNRFGLEVVGDGSAYGGTANALAIVAADGDGRYIDLAALTPDDEEALASWLADPGPPKAVHDAKPARHALAGRGWMLRGVTSDTALAAHLLLPERRSLALNDLLVHHMRCALPAEAVGPQHYSDGALILRTCAVLDLADVLDEELARIDSSSLLGRMELPVQQVLTEMEATGIAVSAVVPAQVDALVSVAPDGRIHPTFHQTRTATGRLTSSDPDLDNVPRLWEAFVAGHDFTGLMTATYRELDAAIWAHFVDEAAVIEEARAVGYAASVADRRRYLPDLTSKDRSARESAERSAVAATVEGSAADVVKMAMINIDQALKALGLRSRMLLQAGGELMFEVADGERETLAEYVLDGMSAAGSGFGLRAEPGCDFRAGLSPPGSAGDS